jgi:hypothetical protein
MNDKILYKRWILALWKWATRRALKAGYGRGYLQQFISDAPRGMTVEELREMIKVEGFD